MSTPPFPGATAVSNLRVYPWEADDGLHGGTPHMHTVSSEAYVVLGGAGEVHTLSAEGSAVDTLTAGTMLWFTPGTVHRLVNTGDLEILVVMSNAGLPEAGDAVMTFPREILTDPEAYRRHASLPEGGTDDEREAAARQRRDLALHGYHELRAAVDERGPAALAEFHRLAAALVQPKVQAWQQLWNDTVDAETARTREHLQSLAVADSSHLSASSVVRTTPRPEPRLFGMCGRLQTWQTQKPAVEPLAHQLEEETR